MLEELKLDIARCNFEQPLDLFCGQATRLRDVALDNIPVRWDSDVLVGLRSLDTKEKVQYLPTDGQMRRLLEANPGLEKMDIEAWDETDTEHFEEDAVQSTREGKPSRVVMSNLHELRLFNLPLELVQAVLGHIEIPSIGYFMLRLLGPNIKHLVSPLLQRSKGAQRAELTFEESSIEFAIYTPHHEIPTIQMQLRETVLSNGFDWLAENFFHAEGLPSVGAADIFHVSLKFQGGFDMGGGRFIPILDRLNAVKVKDLTIESWDHRGEELIKYLGAPKEDSQWPLPYLTSMTIDGLAELANHLLIALQRREQYAPAGDTSAAPRPVALEVLDIGGLRGVDEDVEKTLANCVASSGTFIPARQGWEAGGRTPNPYGGGMTPAWGVCAPTPAWGGGSTTPNPYAGGMTPNPYAGGMTPNPYAGGMTPTWQGGGATPNSTHWEGDVFGAGNNESV
ncbi:hypothetical protein FRC00_005857 [Tulasnella sp. 408]|nr:hypothetical protein FRC00_005857 [Tulasnella sp. 408]